MPWRIQMTRYDQTTFSDPELGTHGDCCRACVATILQIDPATLPHPIADGGGWNTRFFGALREIGYSLRTVDYIPGVATRPDLHDESWSNFVVPGLVMAAGPSPRGPWHHAVVWDRFDERMIHDPHPSRQGLQHIAALDYLAPYPRPEAP